MPTTNPYDALKTLLAGSSDLNAGDPNGMVGNRLKLEDILKARHEHGDDEGVSLLADTLNTMPNFGPDEVSRVKQIQTSNDAALRAGFTGDRQINGPAEDTDPSGTLGSNIYANFGARNGGTPGQQASQYAMTQAANKDMMPLRVAQANAFGDVEKEREATRGKLELEALKRQGMQDSFKQFLQLRPGATASHEPTGGIAPSAAAQPPQPQQSDSQSWMNFLTGKGPNSLGSALGAMSERQKYGVMDTPTANMIQNESFGNLEQLQAQFPGVRGFSYLLPKLKEHQSHFGQGLQTPQASHTRLGNMTQILDELEQDMADPSSHMAQAASGEWHFTSTPAAVQRALSAIHDTKKRFQDAQMQMEQQYPELGSHPAAAVAPSSRFQRIQD